MSRIKKDIKTHEVFAASFGDPSNGVSALKHLKQQVVEVSLLKKQNLDLIFIFNEFINYLLFLMNFYEFISFPGIFGGSHELYAFLGRCNDLCGVWSRKGFQNISVKKLWVPLTAIVI